MTKRKIWRDSAAIDYMNGQEVIDEINRFCQMHNVAPLELSVERDYNYDSCTVTLQVYSIETDEEYKIRQENEQKIADGLREIKMKQFETLKKELGL